jgi:hypothetical protein
MILRSVYTWLFWQLMNWFWMAGAPILTSRRMYKIKKRTSSEIQKAQCPWLYLYSVNRLHGKCMGTSIVASRPGLPRVSNQNRIQPFCFFELPLLLFTLFPQHSCKGLKLLHTCKQLQPSHHRQKARLQLLLRRLTSHHATPPLRTGCQLLLWIVNPKNGGTRSASGRACGRPQQPCYPPPPPSPPSTPSLLAVHRLD